MASGLIRVCLLVCLVVLVYFVAEDQALKMSLTKALTFKKYTLAEKSRALKHIAQKTFNKLMSRHKGYKKATKPSDCDIDAFEDCLAVTADMPQISATMDLDDQSSYCDYVGMLDLCVSEELDSVAGCDEDTEQYEIVQDGLFAVAVLSYICGNETLPVIVENYECVEQVLTDETCINVIDERQRSKHKQGSDDESDTPEENSDECLLLQQFLECFANDAATSCGENSQVQTIIEDLVKIFAAPYLGNLPDNCDIDSSRIVRAAKLQRAQHKVDQKKSQLQELIEKLGLPEKRTFPGFTGYNG